jgi:hypothetical protein
VRQGAGSIRIAAHGAENATRGKNTETIGMDMAMNVAGLLMRANVRIPFGTIDTARMKKGDHVGVLMQDLEVGHMEFSPENAKFLGEGVASGADMVAACAAGEAFREKVFRAMLAGRDARDSSRPINIDQTMAAYPHTPDNEFMELYYYRSGSISSELSVSLFLIPYDREGTLQFLQGEMHDGVIMIALIQGIYKGFFCFEPSDD